jgi:vacuolar-type H+-ATPase subunit I/STV1
MSTQPVNNKHRVSAYLYTQLYTKLALQTESHTEIITKALELYFDKLDHQEDKNYNVDKVNSQVYLVQQERISDLQSHNETLRKELEDHKQMHNNYMLQVQSIINQRAIEESGAKRPWWRFW